MKNLKKKISVAVFIRFFDSTNYLIFYSNLISTKKKNLKSHFLLNYACTKLPYNFFLNNFVNNFLIMSTFSKRGELIKFIKNLDLSFYNLYFLKFKQLCILNDNFKIFDIFKVLNINFFLLNLKKILFRWLYCFKFFFKG